MRLKRRLRRLLEKRLDRRYEKNLKLYEMNYDTRLEDEEEGPVPVSYTHLTLPTICSV